MALDDELYPGERDVLGKVVYDISREIILSDPNSPSDIKDWAETQLIAWEDADEETKADCLRTAWAIRQKVLRDRNLSL